MQKGRLADRAKFLKLASISISHGLRAGVFSSMFRGRGIEFDSVREYEFDDDVRSIDWNLTAKSGKAFVKLYKEERDLNLFLLVDLSSSIRSSMGNVSLVDKALDIAGLLLFAGFHAGCPVGAIPFDGDIGHVILPKHGEEHVLSLLYNLEKFASKNMPIQGTALKEAITGATKNLRGKAMVVIISDFKVSGYESQFGLLTRRHDTVAVRITSQSDKSLPSIGTIPAVDPETGVRILLPTNSKAFKDSKAKLFSEDLTHWQNLCLKYGALPLHIADDADVVKALTQFFISAKNKSEFINNLEIGRSLH